MVVEYGLSSDKIVADVRRAVRRSRGRMKRIELMSATTNLGVKARSRPKLGEQRKHAAMGYERVLVGRSDQLNSEVSTSYMVCLYTPRILWEDGGLSEK